MWISGCLDSDSLELWVESLGMWCSEHEHAGDVVMSMEIRLSILPELLVPGI